MIGNLASVPAAHGRWVGFVAGGCLPLAFAPFNLFFLAPLSLAALFLVWDASPREAAWRGFWFGVAAFSAGTWWLYISVRLVGGTPLPVALLLLGGLVGLMAVYIAACGYLAARWRGSSDLVRFCLLTPALWVTVEWLRGWLFTGFPWLGIGYGQIDGPLGVWAPVTGVHGVSLVTAVIAGALVTAARAPGRDRLAAALMVVALSACTWALSGRSWTEPSGPELRVSLVQGAVPQLLKWEPGEREATMELYWSMTSGLRDQDIIVWPEAAIPATDAMVRDYLDAITDHARQLGASILVGILTEDEERDEYRNSLLALGEPRGVYHKRHLVPFGEFFPVPDVVRQWMRLMNLPYSDITAGPPIQPPLVAAGVALAPTICYEDAFGAEQRVFLPAAQMLINVSNDAWFGDTIAPHQHLQMARMRALEAGRYMLRSTNTGITAIIDERGAVRQAVPQFRPAVLSGVAQPFAGATPYVRTGNWPVLTFCAAMLAIAVVRRSQRAPL